jgi:kumamolisin
MADASHVALPGSDRPAKAGATRVSDADPAASVEVTLTLRGRDLPEAGEGPPGPISRNELASQYGASQSDVDAVREALGHYGLTVPTDSVSLAARTVMARGTVAQMQEAFGTNLAIYRNDDQGEFRGRDGALSIPRQLDGIITGVFGLDERRVARRNGSGGAAGASTAAPMGPADFEQHYSFPAGDGTGQTIGIAEFGGGYFDTDLQAFNQKYGRAMPNVVTVPCGAPAYTLAQIQALPQDQQQAALEDSGEVMLDIEIAGSLCPGAELVVYFAPFTQKGWVDLLTAVIDGKPASPLCLSVSWGLAEDAPDWSSAALQAINQQLGAVANLGITVLAASGDDGSGDQMNDGKFHVNFPASSSNVLAVGGTQLDASNPPNEIVWWESPGDRAGGGGSTGGGVSTVSPVPRGRR